LLCATLAAPAYAETEVEQLRQEIRLMREEYEQRLRVMEERLQEAEAQAAQRPAETDEQSAPVAAARPPVSGNAFNPAISATVQAKLSSYSENPEEAPIPGFQVGGETGLPPEGFSLDETEITVSANVDQAFYGEITIGLHEDEGETEVDVEEAFFETLALPGGLSVRGGRFYSGIGYLNRFHTHAWDFHDEPLVYRAFLGGQYGDDGARLNWIAPTDLYIDAGIEVLQGNSFPGGSSSADFGDSRAAFIHVGDDVGTSHSWRGGLSYLTVDSTDRTSGHGHGGEAGGTSFTGNSDLWIADFVWKWAPNGNPTQRNFVFSAEYFDREEDGAVTFTEDSLTADLTYDGDQRGFYLQGIYQFMPRWRAGLRYDWLDSDNRVTLVNDGGLDPDEVLDEVGLVDATDNPERWSLMTDYSPSEYSRLRLQYNHDDSRGGPSDRQITLQYIMSLGAHGAHEF
ncbi:MAG: hypothetical protein R3308_09195, partial [Thiohalobacterales bacterium]|nr:hypothetical protein [Thiohalobacterales bacterium]